MTNVNKSQAWFSNAKFIIGTLVTIVGLVLSVTFWVQSTVNYAVAQVQIEVVELRGDIKHINEKNAELLRIVGTIEGKITALHLK